MSKLEAYFMQCHELRCAKLATAIILSFFKGLSW